MKYVQKPVIIEAFKWTGGPDQTEEPNWIVEALKRADARFVYSGTRVGLRVKTADGEHATAQMGDYLVNQNGTLYVMPPEVFNQTYEEYHGEEARDPTSEAHPQTHQE